MSQCNSRYRFIYIHIPKTAGSSIEEVKPFTDAYNKHADMSFYNSMLKLTQTDILDNYFKFAFVRNPYDRFMSGVLNHVINKELPRNIIKQKIYKFVTEQSDFNKQVVLREQNKFISVEGKLVVDFIGRFENLQNDFDVVCDKLGIKHTELPHVNKGKFANYDLYYTPEVKNIVSEYFIKDFELFGY